MSDYTEGYKDGLTESKDMNEREKIREQIEPFIRNMVENALEIYDTTSKSKTVKGQVVNVLAGRLKYDVIDIMRILEDD